MIREIIKDPSILTQKSEPFIFGQDDHIIQDMLDTANACKDNCAGLAAVQIGYHKRAILIKFDFPYKEDEFRVFINPTIIKKNGGTYAVKEGCLSLDGARVVNRHRAILVSYMNENGKKFVKEFKGYIAQIIQHEVDHLNGVLI